jgi:hypothetical protein
VSEQQAPPPAAIADDRQPQSAPAGTLALLALVWLLAVLSSSRQIIGDSPDPTAMTITRAALELPQVVSASLVAGAAVGLAAVSVLARLVRELVTRTASRLAASTAAGVITGAAIAVPIVLGYAQVPGIRPAGTAIGAAAVLGGMLAGVRHRAVVAAGVAGALAMFVVSAVAGAFDGNLRTIFGGGDNPESILAASGWVVLTTALVAGVLAGALAYLVLRRAAHPPVGWPAYLLAGALPGLLALAAEAVTRLGGVSLFPRIGLADQIVREFLTANRINQALVVLFTGAVVSLFLLGRALRPGSTGSGAPDEPVQSPSN